MASKAPATDRLTMNLEPAGRILGISRPTMYELARRDVLPIPVIRIGRRMVVSRRAVEELLDRRKPGTDGEAA